MIDVTRRSLAVFAVLGLAAAAGAQEEGGLVEKRARLGLPADESVLCAKCHEGHVGPAREGEEFVHAPVEQGRCLSCHNPHASRHGSLLTGDLRGLCFTCHADFPQRLESPFVHSPAAEGQCTSCHNPHRSELARGLQAEGMDLCGKCHQDLVAATENEEGTVHGPFMMGDCLACHDPHAGQGEGNVVAEGAELCGQCHDLEDEDLSEQHLGAPLAELDCTSCHTPHHSPNATLIRTLEHPPFEELACDMCHDTEAEDARTTLDEPPDLCFTCHDDVTKVPNQVVAHAPAEEGMCLACHTPHASDQQALLAAKPREVCLSCHDEIKQRAEASTASHLSYNDGNCVGCHTPHASAQPKLIRASIIGTCAVCHEGHSNLQMRSHPMGEDVIDPRNGLPVDCLSCHDPHGTQHAFFLRDDPRRDLCVSCHDVLQ